MARQRFALDLASIRQLASGKGPGKQETDDLRETKRQLRKEQRTRAEAAADLIGELIGHELGDKMSEVFASLAASDGGDDAGEQVVWIPHLEEIAVIALDRMGRSTASAVENRFLEVCQGDSATANYAALLYQWKHSPTPIELLRPALVTMLASGFNDFLAALLRTWKLPKTTGDYSVSEAMDLLRKASEHATKLLSNKPSDWCRKVSEEVGVDLEKITPERWHSACEVFARRNAIVHTGGRADQRYRERVRGLPFDPPGLGAFLKCDETYVADAAETFEGLADVLAVGFGTRLAPKTDEAAHLANDAVFRALRSRRYQEARYMAESVLEGLPPDHDHHELRVNLWMAKQEQPSDNEVALRPEIKKWTPPADNPRFRLAKAALLDDEAEAIAALAALDASGTDGTTNVNELQMWPLIVRLRGRYPEFDKQFKLALGRKRPRPT